MNRNLLVASGRRQTWLAALLVWLLSLGAHPGHAQLYYGLSDAVNASTLDQLRRVPLAGGAEQTIVGSNTSGYPTQPTLLAYDPANNRLFVTTSTTNAGLRIAAVELTTFGVSTFVSPAATANATTTQITGLAVGGPGAPTLTTATPTGVSATAATLGGAITSDGGAIVTERGVVYSSTNSTPTIGNGTQRINGAGTGTFSATSTGLTANITYYVQAYATNSVGTSYGGVQTFTTPATPVITSLSPSSGPVGTTVLITGTNYALGATVTFNSTAATSVTVNSATQITAQVPTGATTGNVVVTTSTGSSNGLAFTVTAPTTVTAINTAAPSPTNASSVSYTVVFANSVTGLSPSNFSVTTTGTVSGASISSVSGAGTTYTVTVTTGTGTGTLRLNLATTIGISPSVSNVPFNGATYTIDKTAPTVLISSAAGASGSITATTPVSFTVTFSESVTGFAAGDLSVTGGTVSGFTGSGSTYTFNVTPSGSGTTVVVNVPANVAQDAAGNANTAATQFSITYQQPTTATPSLTSPTNNSTANGFPTFAGTAPANAQVTLYLNNTSAAQLTADASGSFSGLLSAALPSGSYTAYVTAQLSGQSVSANSNINTFTVDNTPPTVSISSSTATSGSTTTTSPFAYTVTFSESVTGFVAGDVTVSNGTISNFLGSGNTYTFSVTPTTVGTAVVVSVPANVAQDAVGNQNTAAPAAYSLTFQAPTIVVAPATLPNGTQGTAYGQTLTASGGTAPYTFVLTAGALPSGLTLTSAGTLAGTPTANGSFNFTVTATDASAAPGPYNGPRSYTLTIAAPVPTLTSWTGTVSTDWYTVGNWTAGVPTATVDATINQVSSGRYPLVAASTAATRNLSINLGATLNMSGGTLDVRGNLTNNSAFVATGGTVVLGTSTLGTIVGSGTTNFRSLRVESNGALLATSAGATVQQVLTLNGGFSTNGNSFMLLSNATGTALVVNNGSNVVSGPVTVQRYIVPDFNPNLGYRHVSAPISNATVGSLATGSFAPVVNPAYNTSATPGQLQSFPTVYGYDQSRLATTTNNLAAFDKGWYSPAALSDPLTVGQGYTVNLAAGQTWNFTGTLNNGNVSQTMARNSGITAADAGLALVGNPYPSPLDWSQVATADRPNVDGIIYVFVSNDPSNPYTGNYSFYQGGFGNISPVLPVGQGFFVRVTPGQTSGTLNLNNSHRAISYTNPTYHRPAETRSVVHLTLHGAGSALTDDAFVYFEASATDGFDAQYDGEKLPNPSGLNLSTSLSATQRLCVNGLAPLGAAQRVVPLAVGVPVAGSYTLDAAELLNLSTTPVYLHDRQTGALLDLAQQPSYQFTVPNASALLTGRFELVFSPQATLTTAPAALAAQVGLYPNPASASAFVELPADLGRAAVAAQLVDALGRPVRHLSLPAQGAAPHRLNLATLATGVYTLHLQTSAGVIVRKLVVQ